MENISIYFDIKWMCLENIQTNKQIKKKFPKCSSLLNEMYTRGSRPGVANISVKGWIINILSIASHEVSFLTMHLSYYNIKSIVRSKVTLTIPPCVWESRHKLSESPCLKVGHNTLIPARHGSPRLWSQHLGGGAKEMRSFRQASVRYWVEEGKPVIHETVSEKQKQN